MTCSLSIRLDSYSCKKALCWGNSYEHFQKSKVGSLCGRIIHVILAVLECIPIIGQIISLFELVVAKSCKKAPSGSIPIAPLPSPPLHPAATTTPRARPLTPPADPPSPVKPEDPLSPVDVWGEEIDKLFRKDDPNDHDQLAALLSNEALRTEWTRTTQYDVVMKAALVGSKNHMELAAQYGSFCSRDNRRNCSSLNTPLIWAIANAHNGAAKKIIELTPIEKRESFNYLGYGNSALHIAIAKGYKTISKDGARLDCPNVTLVEALLERGADPNIRALRRKNQTPLHVACIRRNPQMIAALLRHGADPTLQDDEGHTPQELLTLGYQKACASISEFVGDKYLLDEETYNNSFASCTDLFKLRVDAIVLP